MKDTENLVMTQMMISFLAKVDSMNLCMAGKAIMKMDLHWPLLKASSYMYGSEFDFVFINFRSSKKCVI